MKGDFRPSIDLLLPELFQIPFLKKHKTTNDIHLNPYSYLNWSLSRNKFPIDFL